VLSVKSAYPLLAQSFLERLLVPGEEIPCRCGGVGQWVLCRSCCTVPARAAVADHRRTHGLRMEVRVWSGQQVEEQRKINWLGAACKAWSRFNNLLARLKQRADDLRSACVRPERRELALTNDRALAGE
jgi:hypothetical protein